MRRTARALSVAALVGVVLGFVASAAWADPAAEVSPGTVSPGGSITVSVSCDPLEGSAPGAIDAVSQVFEEGTVQLKLVSGNDEKAAGPAYSGTARVPPAENFEGDPDAVGSESAWTVDGTCPAVSGAEGKAWSAPLTVTRDSGGGDTAGGGKDGGGKDGSGGGTDAGVGGKDGSSGATDGSVGGKDATEGGKDATGGDQGGKQGTESGTQGTGGGKQGTEGGKDGAGSGSRRPCTGSGAPADGTAPDRSVPYSQDTEASWDKGDSHSEDCDRADTEHGVQAGAGGTFTDSVPALVAGGVLITGALGGAVYRLRRRTPAAED
ncbi:hypothetical protein SAMN04487981_104331 [Streptomyces sp. cf386]|uniref:hypothetical protein n=1 Tax=Streptomyces sp. cf386 TaxID=1761904 RepID=UPI0008901400|nr:hypothetical protein [Streptomyces sp. cf386]SDN28890.1 hypothetical protein SAMN04487981_104331 [Streptomyces sp. cf386]